MLTKSKVNDLSSSDIVSTTAQSGCIKTSQVKPHVFESGRPLCQPNGSLDVRKPSRYLFLKTDKTVNKTKRIDIHAPRVHQSFYRVQEDDVEFGSWYVAVNTSAPQRDVYKVPTCQKHIAGMVKLICKFSYFL